MPTTSFRQAVYPLLDSTQNAVDLTLSNDVAAAATSLIVNYFLVLLLSKVQ